jgi:hypothetical protein
LVMEFKPGIFKLGVVVSLGTVLFFAAVLLWPVYRRRVRVR